MALQNNPPIGKLPEELFLLVAELLGPQTLTQLFQVCKSVNELLHPAVQKAAQRHALPGEEVYAQRFIKQPDGSLRMAHWPSTMLPRERLVDAIRTNRLNVVANYLRAGIDPNAYCLFGARLLSISIRNRKSEITDLLLSYGADPSLPNVVNTITPLSQALRVSDPFKSNNFVRNLITAGADLSQQGTIYGIVRHCPLSTILLALHHGGDICQLDTDGSTALHAVRNDTHKLDFVLQNAPEFVSVRNIAGETPFFAAIHTGNEAFASAYLAASLAVSGYDLAPLNVGCTRLSGETALHTAIKARMAELSIRLIDLGVAVDRRARWGTELHYAVKYKLVPVVRRLIAAGVDVNAPGPMDCTPLMCAIENNDIWLVELLADEANADLSVQNRAGLTAVQLARSNDFDRIADYLEILGGF